MSSLKEPHYFVRGAVAGRLPDVVTRGDHYDALWAAPGNGPKGEASVLYLSFADELVQRINTEMASTPKLIVSLRDPVERAYSSFLDVRLKNPDEVAATFAEAVQREMERGPWRLDGDGSPTLRHLALGRYSRGLRTLMEAFGRGRVLVLLYDEYVRAPAEQLQRVAAFVGTSHDVGVTGAHENAGGRQWTGGLDRAMRAAPALRARRWLARRAPGMHRTVKRGAVHLLSHQAPQISREMGEFLSELYRDEVGELQEILQRSLADWLDRW